LEISQISKEQFLVLRDGTRVLRPEVELVEGVHTVYNFEVEEYHNYVAGGYRVHNDSVEIYGAIGSAIGGLIASELWKQLGTDDVALGVLVPALGSGLGRVAGLAIHDLVFPDQEEGFAGGIANLSSNLAFGAASGFGGYFGGFLAGELFPDSPVARLVGSTLGSTLTSAALSNVFRNAAFLDTFSSSFPSAIGGAFGNYVASLALAGVEGLDPEGEAIGSAIGGVTSSIVDLVAGEAILSSLAVSLGIDVTLTAGVAGAAGIGAGVAAGAAGAAEGSVLVALGAAGPPGWILAAAFAFVTAFAGDFLGGLIGGLFRVGRGTPRGNANVDLDTSTGEFHLSGYGVDNGLDAGIVVGLGRQAAEAGNAILQVAGGVAFAAPGVSLIYDTDYGIRASNGSWTQSANQAISDAVVYQVKNTQIEGGDLYVKRAIRQSTESYIEDFVGDLDLARRYGVYMDSPAAYNEAMEAGDPIEFQKFEDDLARAEDLKLGDNSDSTNVTVDGFARSGANTADDLTVIPSGERRYGDDAGTGPEPGDGQEARELLVLDLGGDGLDLVSRDESGVYFDMDGDGYKEATAWVGPADGLLVIDSNNNGRIDSVSEVFTHLSSASAVGVDGALALESLDSNSDGILDRNDPDFWNVRVWVDFNQNGVTDFGELQALWRYGIMALSFNEAPAGATLEGGRVVSQARYLQYGFSTGYLGTAATKYFGGIYRVSFIHDIQGTGSGITDPLAQLGSIDFEGRGSLTFAASDAPLNITVDGRVSGYVLGGAGNDIIRSAGDDDLMINAGDGDDTLKGAGGNDILVGSGGIDQLFGGAGDDILVFDKDDVDGVGTLSTVIDGGDGFDTLVYESDDGITIDISAVNAEAFVGNAGDDVVTGGDGGIVLGGGDGDDTLTGGKGGDTLSGDNGDDTLVGGDGNDTISGGLGSDTLSGGRGDDVLQIDADDLQENIDAGTGTDVIVVEGSEGVTLDLGAANAEMAVGGDGDDHFFTTGSKSIQLSGGTGDDVFSGSADSEGDLFDGGSGLDTVSYADSDTAITIDLSVGSAQGGAAENDVLYSIERVIGTAFADSFTGDDYDNSFEGGAGADSIDGGEGADTASYESSGAAVSIDLTAGTISGGDAAGDTFTSIENLAGSAFDDSLKGSAAANVLAGGKGSDLLTGGGGDDTYLFNRGDGQDTIIHSDGDGAVVLGGGIDPAEINFFRNGNDLVLTFLNTDTDVLTIKDWWPEEAGGRVSFYLENGTDIGVRLPTVAGAAGIATLDDPADDSGITVTYGTASGNSLSGGTGEDRIHGLAGNDTISGGAGNDYIAGDTGDDTISDSAGDDTYFFTRGDGIDTISDTAGTDTLQFGFGIDQGDLVFQRSGNSLIIEVWKNGAFDGDRVTITDWFVAGKEVDTVKLFDGHFLSRDYIATTITTTTASGADLEWSVVNLSVVLTNQSDDFFGGAGNDYIDGAELHDRLLGGVGNDTLVGGADVVFNGETFETGNDFIVGGKGNDALQGGGGNDVYFFGRGDGRDTVFDDYTFTVESDFTANTQSQAILRDYFAAEDGGPAPGSVGSDFWFTGYDNSRISSAAWGTGSVVGWHWEWTGDGGTQFPVIAFTPASSFSVSETHHYDGGDDTLYFGLGIDPDDLEFKLDGPDLLIGVRDPSVSLPFDELSDQIRVTDWHSPDHRIEKLHFSDGTVLSDSDVLARLGTDDAETITWFSGQINLSLGDGDDVVTFGASDDGAAGEAGNDLLDGGAGNDVLDGGDGADTLLGGDGSDLLMGGAGSDSLDGGAGDDVLDGGDGDDTLLGGIGNDTLSGGAGADEIDGGDGRNTVSYADSDAGVTVNLDLQTVSGGYATGDTISSIVHATGSDYDDTLTGDDDANRLEGGAGDDSLYGGEGYDLLIGGKGDDVLYGQVGDDRLKGEEGDDVLIGGDGADWLYGGDGFDTADYSSSTSAIVVDLSSGTGTGGDAEGDLFFDIEKIVATDGDDTLTGNDQDNEFDGGAGADTISGGSGIDTVAYTNSSSGVTVSLQSVSGVGGDAQGDVLSAIENLTGSDHADWLIGDGQANRLEGGAGDDRLTGDDGDDRLIGGAGADVLEGGDGIDTADYSGSASPISVDLSLGTTSGGDAAGDTLSDIENLVGSDGADTLVGDAGANVLEGGSGADTLDGGSGLDTASYESSADGVFVDLSTGTLSGGHAQGDTLTSIENLIGSAHNDTLIGTSGDNVLEGGAGYDLLIGGAGADVLDGGLGVDTASYEASSSAVTIDLASGMGTGGDAQGDTLTSVEDVVGSNGDDVFVASDARNKLDGGDGVDTVSYAESDEAVVVDLNLGVGTGGYAEGDELVSIENVTGSNFNDTIVGDDSSNLLVGDDGDDRLLGGEGDDSFDGGSGNDTVSYADAAVAVSASLVTNSGALDHGASTEYDTFQSIENLEGSSFDDVLIGDSSTNILSGGDGDDVITGGAGDDVIDGGLGNADVAVYTGNASGFTVTIENGEISVVNSTASETDTLTNVEILRFDDGDISLPDLPIAAESVISIAKGEAIDGNASTIGGQSWGGTVAFSVVDGPSHGTLTSFDADTGAYTYEPDGGYAGEDTFKISVVAGEVASFATTSIAVADFNYQPATAVNFAFAKTSYLEQTTASAGDTKTWTFSAWLQVGTLQAVDRGVFGAKGDDGWDRIYLNDDDKIAIRFNGEDGGELVSDDPYTSTTDWFHVVVAVDTTQSTAADRVKLYVNGSLVTLAGTSPAQDFETRFGSATTYNLGRSLMEEVFAEFDGRIAQATFVDGQALSPDSFGATDSGNVWQPIPFGGAFGANDWQLEFSSDVDAGFDSSGNGNSWTPVGIETTDIVDGPSLYDPNQFAQSILGTVGRDVLHGGDSNDFLSGDDADDSLYGGDGDDTLLGGAGADILDGGTGSDTVSYEGSPEGVTITLGGTVDDGDAAGDTLISIENIIGSSFDDVLTGNSDANIISGGAGDDRLIGEAGADEIIGGEGVDTIDYSDSSSAVSVDLLAGTGTGGDAQGDSLSEIENIIGTSGADTIEGDSADNTIEGGAGADTLDGRSGRDTLSYAASGVAVAVDLSLAVVSGGDAQGDAIAGFENVVGTGFADSLTGDGGDNVIEGGAGADTLAGGDGNDTVVYSRSDAGVSIDLDANTASGGEAAGDAISGFENVIGSAYSDVLTGNGAANSLEGGEGDDTLAGGAGDDILIGGGGNDVYRFGKGDGADEVRHSNGAGVVKFKSGVAAADVLFQRDDDDLVATFKDTSDSLRIAGWFVSPDSQVTFTLSDDSPISVVLPDFQGTSRDDDLEGSADADWVAGGRGDDLITGLDGDDIIDGGKGDDILEGGPGADLIKGGEGADFARYASSFAGVTIDLSSASISGGDAAGDTLMDIENLEGSSFADALTGDGQANVLLGGDGDDALSGADGNDLLEGGSGADTLSGGDGDDILNGGSGADTLVGGAGTDTATYVESDNAVEVDLAGSVTGGYASGDTLSGIENLIGSNFDDVLMGDSSANSLTGGAGDDVLEGRGGADALIGGFGSNWASYLSSGSAVTINLSTGTISGGDAAGDTFSNIENVEGSAYADTLAGDSWANGLKGGAGNDDLDGGDGDDVLEGGAGADALVGGAGSDTASYAGSSAAVSIVRIYDTSTGGDAEGDTFSSIENFIGSSYSDYILGDSEDNVISGGAGNDSLAGWEGADTLIGGDGDDTISYPLSPEAVIVDLEAGIGRGGHAEGDTYESIEAAWGSSHDDTLLGSEEANWLFGDLGDDYLDGRDGIDYAGFAGSLGDYAVTRFSDTVVVEDLNSADGDDGTDVLSNIENLYFITDSSFLDLSALPEAKAAKVITQQNTAASGNLVGSDDSTAVNLLTFSLVTAAGHGTASVASDGSFTYTPTTDYSGPDSFEFGVVDGDGYRAIGEISVVVSAGPTGSTEERANTTASGTQSEPVIAALPDGGYVVIWTSSGQDGSSDGVYAQRFDQFSQEVGGEFRINSYTAGAQNQPSVASSPSGGFVVTWTSAGQDGSGNGIYGQRFDADAQRIGSEFRANTSTTKNQEQSTVAALADGGFVVAWAHWREHMVTHDEGYYIYNPDPPYQATWVPDLVTVDEGDYEVYGQRYDANGTAIGSEFHISTYMPTGSSQDAPSVVGLAGGGFVVVWDSSSEDGSGHGVYARRYDESGSALGSEFRINTYINNDQQLPSIAALSDGGFMVVWESNGQDGSGWSTYGQRYDSSGSAVGGEFLVTTTTSSDQYEPTVTGLSDGGFVVAWANYDSTNNYQIYAQRFDADGTKLGDEFTINTYSSGVQREPQITALAGGGFAVVWQDESGHDGSSWGVYTSVAGALNQILVGADGNDVLVGGDYDDTLIGGVGADKLDGGDGSDTARYAASGAGVTIDLSAGTGTGGDAEGDTLVSIENVVGSSFGDTLRGNSADNVLDGGAGTDVAEFSGSSSGYQITRIGSDVVVVDTNSGDGDDGTDTVRGVETLSFLGDSETVSIDVLPVAGNSEIVTQQGKSASGALSATDDATAPGQLNYALEEGPSNGSATVNSDGSYTYTPGLGYSGPDSFTFLVTDEDGNRSIGTATVEIVAAAMTASSEDRANTYTSSTQYLPAVAGLTDGGYVAVWASAGQDGSAEGVYGQRYDASGQKVGSEFHISTYTSNAQSYPAVAGLPTGGFVVTWQSSGQDGSDQGVYAQRYDASGAKAGSEFEIPTITAGRQQNPSVATFADGGFVAAWTSEREAGGYGVSAQLYDDTGTKVGSEIYVNTYTSSAQEMPVVAVLSSGGFVIAWQSNGQDGGGYGVYAQRYDASGSTIGSEFRINTYTSSDQKLPSIAALSNGGFVVVWESNGQDGSGRGIYGQTYDSSGSAVGGEFLVNTTTSSEQREPWVTGLNGGGFVVTWANYDSTNNYQIYAQRFDADGAKLGDEFTINTYSSGVQREPQITALAGGGFAVVWQDESGHDGSSYGVYTAAYTPIAQTLTGSDGNDVLIGGEGNDTLIGGAGADTLDGGFGEDVLVAGDGSDLLKGGDGNDWLVAGTGSSILEGGAGDDTFDASDGDVVTIRGGDGNDTAQYFYAHTGIVADLSLGAGLSGDASGDTYDAIENIGGSNYADEITGDSSANVLSGYGGSDILTGGAGDDLLIGGVSDDLLSGGAGSDTYRFSLGDGQDVIDNQDSGSGDDVLEFGTGAGHEELWLQHTGDDLVVSVMGSDDKVTFKDWYVSDDQKVDSIAASDGYTLLSSQVDLLVTAMAAFEPANGDLATIFKDNIPKPVQLTLASAWQAGS
jgi:Ca2+-binding RTX toxin-like protein